MGKQDDAISVLGRMMDELARDSWPTEATWAEACRLVGRPVPAALDSGKSVSLLEAVTSGPRRFETPTGTAVGAGRQADSEEGAPPAGKPGGAIEVERSGSGGSEAARARPDRR